MIAVMAVPNLVISSGSQPHASRVLRGGSIVMDER